MVVRRTVHHLRSRPRHEREAVAAWVAIGVVIILFLGWAVFFFRGIDNPSQQFQGVPTAIQNINAAAVQAAQGTQAPQSTPAPSNAYEPTTYDTNTFDSNSNIQPQPGSQ